MHSSRLPALVGALILAFASSTQAADQASGWPAQPIRLIVPFAPGGSNDVIARRLSQRMSNDLGQTVVVENRPGAGSTIGTQHVINSKPDGYTLLFVSNSLATTPAVQNLPYDPTQSLTAISMVASAPLVIVTRPGLAKTLPDLVRYAKANPSKLNYGTAGIGDTNHLVTEMFAEAAGVKMEAVAYKGASPAQIDLATGRLDLMITTMASLRGTPADALPKLAFTAAARDADHPDTPTVREATGLDFQASVWWGLFAPAGLPDSVVQALNREVRAAVADPSVTTFLQSIGAQARASTPEEMRAVLAADVKQFTEVAQRAGIRAQ